MRHESHSETPLDILKKRFALGEITKDQYEEMRRILLDGARVHTITYLAFLDVSLISTIGTRWFQGTYFSHQVGGKLLTETNRHPTRIILGR